MRRVPPWRLRPFLTLPPVEGPFCSLSRESGGMMFFMARRLLRWVVVAVIVAVAAPQLGSAAVARGWQALPWSPGSAGLGSTGESSGSPAGGFDPCGVVSYQVYSAPGSPEVGEVRSAVRKVSRLSGVQFQFVGVTDVPPSSAPAQGADMVVGWVFPDETDLLAGGVSGAAVVMVSADDRERYAGASVALNAEHADRFAPGFGSGLSRGALLLHELGHVVGLGHSDSKGDLMFPVLRAKGPGTFSDSERAELATLPRCAGAVSTQ